jgi:hypothetical protein
MSKHDLIGGSRRSRALIGESGEEILRSPVKLQNRRRLRRLESGLGGKLLVRKGDNPDRG